SPSSSSSVRTGADGVSLGAAHMADDPSDGPIVDGELPELPGLVLISLLVVGEQQFLNDGDRLVKVLLIVGGHQHMHGLVIAGLWSHTALAVGPLASNADLAAGLLLHPAVSGPARPNDQTAEV